MIIFDLKCEPHGHVFEAWFGSSEDYKAQRTRGLVACPICGAAEVEKAPMAPKVGAKAGHSGEVPPEAVKAALSDLAAAQKKMLETSEHVGDRFPEEARAIHLGDAEARAIHGRASPADADSLRDEGVPIAPLPFPVREPGEEN
ncbi:MAG TPA: DUF1178 family protein [Allosphingosinicella sp.]|nr:DUF1178 family protein [Allosphingosinicella sp.]